MVCDGGEVAGRGRRLCLGGARAPQGVVVAGGPGVIAAQRVSVAARHAGVARAVAANARVPQGLATVLCRVCHRAGPVWSLGRFYRGQSGFVSGFGRRTLPLTDDAAPCWGLA